MKLLVIEDEYKLSKSICTYFSKYNFICETAYNFNEAIHKINSSTYECVLIDTNLPNRNGLDILKELKSQGKKDGVLIISAKSSLNDKIEGLELGADDYLTKPFHLPELSARIAAIIRRKYFDGQNRIFITDGLIIDIHDKTVTVNNVIVELTRKEYELVLYFTANKNKVVTKEAIVVHLWGDHIDMNDNYDFIYTHVKNLRKKLSENGGRDYIKAVYGMGYLFNTESNEKPRTK